MTDRYLTTEQIVQGLKEHEIKAGDGAFIVKSAADRLEELVRTIDRLRTDSLRAAAPDLLYEARQVVTAVDRLNAVIAKVTGAK